MSQRIASLIAEIGANTTPFEQGASKVKGGLETMKKGFGSIGLSSVASFLSIGGAITGTVAALKNASDETLKYAREVRDLAAVSGTGAEESSRLLQVLDDFELSAQDVTAATRFMTKQGLTPTIDTLAKLSDEYNAINDPMRQNEFILQNLGRGGLQWVNVLKQGGEALRKNSDAVNENLILTDEQIKRTEEYRLALDNMKDTIQGWKVALVTGWLDGMNAQKQATAAMKVYTEASKDAAMNDQIRNRRLSQVSDELQRAQAYGEAWGRVLEDNTIQTYDAAAADEELIKQTQAMSDGNVAFLGTLEDVSGELQTYNEGLAEADAALADGSINAEEHGAKVAELASQYEDATKRIVLSLLEMKYTADGTFDDKEISNYLKAAEQLGVITEADRQATIALLSDVNVLDASLKKAAATTAEQAKKLVNLTGRQDDAVESALSLAQAEAQMGDAIRKDALPAASSLAVQLYRLPPSGTTWNYGFNIETSGGVPGLPESRPDRPVCFLAGTRITLSDGTHKNIETVEIGDAVRSYDTERGEFVSGVVSQVLRRDAGIYLNIDGLLVTREHPFWLVDHGAWTRAAEVAEGDVLLHDDGTHKAVQFVTEIHPASPVIVYNITVEGVHTYFAGGVLVHNKVATAGHAGGMLPGNGYTIVGDNASGWGPDAEVITPWGQVLPHNKSQELKDAGMLEGARPLMAGTDDLGGSYTSGTGSIGGAVRTVGIGTRRTRGGGGVLPASDGSVNTQAPAPLASSHNAPDQVVADSLVSGNRLQATAAAKQQSLVEQTNALLKQLVAMTPTAVQMAKATQAAASKYS